MSFGFINGLPGYGTSLTSTPRTILRSLDGMKTIPGGIVLDGTKCADFTNTPNVDILTNGLMLGKITATGKYAPTIVGVLQADAAGSATSLTVSAAQATEIVRRVGATGTATIRIYGSPTAGSAVATQTLTYSAINTSTGVITVSATSAAYIAGSYITAADGTQTPIAILFAEWAIRMTDYTNTRVDQPLPFPLISADLLAANLPDYSLLNADTKAYAKGLLNASGRTFTYSDDYGS